MKMTTNEEIEEWKDIENYEGLYQVSNFGRVKSLKRNRKFKSIHEDTIKKQTNTNRGYLIVSLSKDGKKKNFYVHRLVAESFIAKIENKNDVNHINENKHDNMVKNLEWCTKKYNNNYGHRLIKAADAHKKKIISINLSDDSKNYFNSVKEAGDYLGIKATNISAVLNNRKNSTSGYSFKYNNQETINIVEDK